MDPSIQAKTSSGSDEEMKKYQRLMTYDSKYRKKLNESSLRGIGWRLRSLIV